MSTSNSWAVPAEAGNVTAGQQHVPVELLESELAEMVEAGLLQQRQADGPREPPGDRLGLVVVVNEERPAEAALDEAVGVAVEPRAQRLRRKKAAHVADQDLALEMGNRASLGRAEVGGVADDEDVRAGLGLERPLIAGHKAERVTQPGRPADVGLPAMRGDDHRQIEAGLTAVERNEPPAGRVHL